ncbi:MAG: nicotinate-nucleotide--dimethylbenzimidazole phosphoribosyltransferase [Desulfofustis sp. PB-SRB1]|nr:nicotinate-nucleotide--dimethylbenzimidazole phosphoribosyltransferase [Desulfofustis sp. PB-SRB1]
MNLLEKTGATIYPQDSEFRDMAVERLEQLTMPHWALGDLMDLAVDLAGITRSMKPSFTKKAVVVMAADHGVTAEGVSKFPAQVTTQMVYNFIDGGAAINAIGTSVGAAVRVVDMGVNHRFAETGGANSIINKKIGFGTGNFARGPAMSIGNARKAVEAGIEVAEELAASYDILATGEMGIGNTTAGTAIAAVVTGKPIAEIIGRGTGIDDEQLAHKTAVIEEALARNRPDAKNGLDVLAKVGGYEIGGIAGLIIGAAARRVPVVIDGLISTAGALVAYLLEPFVRDYLIASHRSVEPGHQPMLDILGCERPLLDLRLRLGEGTGAVWAFPLIDAAAAVLANVATFEEASVSRR